MKTLQVWNKKATLTSPEGAPHQGVIVNVFNKVWEAPFKTDESLMAAIIDYSQRGMFCQVMPDYSDGLTVREELAMNANP